MHLFDRGTARFVTTVAFAGPRSKTVLYTNGRSPLVLKVPSYTTDFVARRQRSRGFLMFPLPPFASIVLTVPAVGGPNENSKTRTQILDVRRAPDGFAPPPPFEEKYPRRCHVVG